VVYNQLSNVLEELPSGDDCPSKAILVHTATCKDIDNDASIAVTREVDKV